jgi:hypothetical protein
MHILRIKNHKIINKFKLWCYLSKLSLNLTNDKTLGS